MSVIIKGIFSIDPKSVEFTSDGAEDGDIICPEKAYEIIADVKNKKIETYGVVWIIDGKAHAFIDEEFEALLIRDFKGELNNNHIISLNNLIFRKYEHQDLELPFIVFQ